MTAINDERKDNDTPWQAAFVDMLPTIEQKLRFAFWRLEPEAREESIAESVARSLLAYCRLHEQGRAAVATPASLAGFSARQVRCGRLAAGRMNRKEPLSRYGQLNNGIKVEQLNGNWIDMLVDDKRAPVADQVAAKMDFRVVRNVVSNDEADRPGHGIRLLDVGSCAKVWGDGKSHQPVAAVTGGVLGQVSRGGCCRSCMTRCTAYRATARS